MITTKRIFLVVAGLAILVASCSSADVAATVDGTEIYDSSVLELRVSNEGRTSVSGEQFRSDLTLLIFTEAMLSAAEQDFGMTGLDSPESRSAFLATATEADQNYLTTVAGGGDFAQSALDSALTQLILRSKVREALGSQAENIQDVWQNSRGELVKVCPRHILVASEDEANDVHTRLETGEDFVAVSNEISLDTRSPGGALPCPSSPLAYPRPFAEVLLTAPLGELNPPIQTGFGWHVIIVDDRQSPASLDELAADPVRWIPADILDSYWSVWLNTVLNRADIEVRSPIGVWFPPVDGIVPPPGSP